MLSTRIRTSPLLLLFVVAVPACAGGGADEPSSVRLVDVFDRAVVTGTPMIPPPEPVVWDFGAGSVPGGGEAGVLLGARAMQQIEGLALRDGALVGRTTGELGFIHIPVPSDAWLEGAFHAAEIRLRVSRRHHLRLRLRLRPRDRRR